MRGLRGLVAPERRAVSYQDVWGSDAGELVRSGAYTPHEAVGISAVVACVRHRADLVAQLPFEALRDVGAAAVAVSPQPTQITRPDPHQLRSIWLAQMMISRDLYGNAVGVVLGRGADQRPTGVAWVDPSRVQISPGAPPVVSIDGQERPFSDVVVVPSTFCLPGHAAGSPPLHRLGLTELSRLAQEYGRDWFKNGAVPSVTVESDTPLTAEQAEQIRDRVVSAWRQRRPAVLGSGLRVSTVDSSSSSSSSVTKWSDVSTVVGVQVAQAFGVDPATVGLSAGGSSLTYANRSDAKQADIDRVNADLVVIQEALSLLVPPGQVVRFNTGAYLRGDLGARYEAYSAGLGAGFIGVDEVRAWENLPPREAS